ncbi:MAG: hypothetical protein R3F59_38430 [Myxococcota bacterium]
MAPVHVGGLAEQLAELQLALGDPDRALATLDDAAPWFAPDDADPLLLYGELLLRVGRWAEAAAAAERIGPVSRVRRARAASLRALARQLQGVPPGEAPPEARGYGDGWLALHRRIRAGCAARTRRPTTSAADPLRWRCAGA